MRVGRHLAMIFCIIHASLNFKQGVAQPAIIDIEFSTDLRNVTVTWENPKSSHPNSDECQIGDTLRWSLVYGCSRSVVSNDDFMTTTSFEIENGGEAFLEKVITLPKMITSGENWTCIFKVQGGRSNDCTTVSTRCAMVMNIESFTRLDEQPEDGTCFSLQSCYGGQTPPLFQTWITQGDTNVIPCPLINIRTLRNNGTDKLMITTVSGNDSTEKVCLSEQVTQVIELCNYINIMSMEGLCGQYSFLFKAKVIAPAVNTSTSSMTPFPSSTVTSSPHPPTSLPTVTSSFPPQPQNNMEHVVLAIVFTLLGVILIIISAVVFLIAILYKRYHVHKGNKQDSKPGIN